MFQDIYKNRRVLITGHTGFKGSWLTAWLLRLGAQVAGFSNGIPTQPSHYELLDTANVQDFRGDVRNREELTKALHSFSPEIVFHLAAQPLVRESYLKPVETIETNAIGTMNLLEAVRTTPSVKAVVCITSDKAYRNDEQVWGYRETDALGGSDPYSASKGCAEFIAHSYFSSFFSKSGPRCVTTRAGNVIGGGDWARDRIVPDCARAWLDDKAVEIRNPNATRPWQHVLEPLSGYLLLGAKLFADQNANCANLAGESFNFGPPADAIHTVADVAHALEGDWQNFSVHFDPLAENSMKECTLLKLCCDKALALLDWRAVLDFDLTMHFTSAWYSMYRKMLSGEEINMHEFTNRQIDAYCLLAKQVGLEWSAEK